MLPRLGLIAKPSDRLAGTFTRNRRDMATVPNRRADRREVSQIVLGLDPDADPARTQRVYDSHLARARWMTTTGYRDLMFGNITRN